VTLLNNEYSEVLIAIKEDVPKGAVLLTSIVSAFTEASAFLYQATK
jgi:hypothetical protein